MSDDVYVARLELRDGVGWTSVHRDYHTAAAAIIDRANDWQLNVLGCPIERLDDLDGHPEVYSYSVMRLPVMP